MSVKRGGAPDTDSPEAVAAREKEAERKARHERSKRIAAERKAKETPVEVPERSDVAADVDVPVPPFWGTRVVKGIALADYTGLLDERALFLGQWGLRGVRGGEGPSYEELVETRGPAAAAVLAGPAVHRRHPRARRGGVRILPCGLGGRRRHRADRADGSSGRSTSFAPQDAPERFRFTFPRQQRGRFLCIADFIRSQERAPNSARSTCCRSNW